MLPLSLIALCAVLSGACLGRVQEAQGPQAPQRRGAGPEEDAGTSFATDPELDEEDASVARGDAPSRSRDAATRSEVDAGSTRTQLPAPVHIDTHPPSPPLSSPAPSPASQTARAPVFFGPENPVVFVNDQPNDVYVDGYILALAANREIQLRGLVSSGVDCKCSAGDNYPRTNTPETRRAWVSAAREAGFQNIPDPIEGTQGPKLVKPASGKPEDTRPIGSPGTSLIVQEARRASPATPLLVIVSGPITTVADAYATDPSIADKVVVSFLAGHGENLDDWNAVADPWATEIVVRRFRTFLFSEGLDPPHVPESRMMAEFPDTKLRKLLVDSGYYKPDYDSDGQAAIPVMLPSFVKSHRQLSWKGDMRLADDPSGNVFVMTRGDSEAAGQEFFRALSRAFAEAKAR